MILTMLINMFPKIKKYLIFTIIIFFCSTIIGITYASTSLSEPDLIELIDDQISGFIKDQPDYILALFIFFNNASTCFLSIIFGLFFGIFPFIVLILNGFLMGYLAYFAYLERGVAYPILALFPHGVIELTAVFICCALGLRIGVSFFKKITDLYTPIFPEIINALKIFIYVSIPLLLIAAFIEIYITPLLIKMFL